MATLTTGKQMTAMYIAARMFLFIGAFALMSFLLLFIGIVLLLTAFVSLVVLTLVGLLCGSLLLVLGLCSPLLRFLLFRFALWNVTAASTRARSSARYQKMRPWVVQYLKRFIRWLLPLLLWRLWQWATAGPSGSSWSQHGHRPAHSLPT